VRHEMARTLEDVLARRTRALFLNAQAAMRMAPRVAELMARELGQNQEWESEQLRSFQETAQNYMVGSFGSFGSFGDRLRNSQTPAAGEFGEFRGQSRYEEDLIRRDENGSGVR